MNALVRRAFAWHRPLMTLAALMLVCAVVSVVGILIDPRVILGAPAWAKPLKFSLSIFLYAITWAWLIAHLPRWRRIAHALGTVVAVALAIEQVAIVWAAATGTTSHFNVSDGVHVAVWTTMAIAIAVVYMCALITSIAVFFLQLPTPSLTFAVRAGAVIGLAGLGVAFFMTGPTSQQLSDFQGIAGAHAVGVADGGPGIPLLGWSTVGGDYRVPHFIGMHALQLLPLLALALLALGRRWRWIAPASVQLRLIVTATVAYAASFVLLTLQAMAGQSVVQPSGVFLIAGIVIAVAAITAAGVVIEAGARAGERSMVGAVGDPRRQ